MIVTTTDFENYKITAARTSPQILTHNDFEDYLYDVLQMSGFMVNRAMFWLSETNHVQIKWSDESQKYVANGGQ